MTATNSDLRLQLTQPPVAKAEMLIRKPVSEVFEAFIDPAITSRFWFSSGSARLTLGAQVQWEWEMYGFSVPTTVLDIVQDERILVEWGATGATTTIEWRFTAREDGTTFVSIANTGFEGTGDERVAQALGSAEGFTFVLAGLKALLEYDVQLNLVPDRFPDGIGAG